MLSIGETLRQARLDKGVSLADAERDTHIRRRYLEALEAEDLASLPSPVYARGMVRTYADYLGLNPEAMVDAYQPPQRREHHPPLRSAMPHIHVPREIPVRPLVWGVGIVAALLFGVYVWTQIQGAVSAFREQDNPAALSGTPTVSPRIPTPNPIAVSSPVPTRTPSPSPTSVPTPVPVPSPTAIIDGILIEFQTTESVYVEASVDGTTVLAETLAADTTRSLPVGTSVVIMRVSNGSAVEITLNGRRQEPPTSTAPVEFTWRR